jgi:hypothetical protein
MSGGGGNTPGGGDGIPSSMSAYVSTSLSDEYAYELSFESNSSTGRAAVLSPKDGGKYSLIVYGVNDKKAKGISEGKIKVSGSGLTLKSDDANDSDITVMISGSEMTQISGKTRGGKHTLPGDVKPFKQETGQSGDFKYTTKPGNTVTIIEYTGKGGAVNIPEQINEKTVIGIGSYVFSDCTSLTSVTIPTCIISLGQGAFSYCTSLSSINIPNGVISIGFETFKHTSLTNVTLPNIRKTARFT